MNKKKTKKVYVSTRENKRKQAKLLIQNTLIWIYGYICVYVVVCQKRKKSRCN